MQLQIDQNEILLLLHVSQNRPNFTDFYLYVTYADCRGFVYSTCECIANLFHISHKSVKNAFVAF